MQTLSQRLTIVRYVSEILPAVGTEDPELGKTIAWADAHPVVWKIVTDTRSKAFGRKSCEYIGWAQRSPAPEAVLERVRHFHTCVDPNVLGGLHYRSRDIWGWRARFTFRQYQAKGFRGGFFQRFDGRYDRDCMTLDFTPETLPEVVRNFMQWAASTPGATPMDAIKLDREPLPEGVLEAARRHRSTIWDAPEEPRANPEECFPIQLPFSEAGGPVPLHSEPLHE